MSNSPGTADSSKNYITKGNDLIQIADAIRLKTGTVNALEYPEDFITAIASISPSVTLQNKEVTPTEQEQTITYDIAYNGLNEVIVNPIPNDYVGSAITRKNSQTYTPTTTNQIISANQYLIGAQTIKGDANLLASNIKKNVKIFNVTGAYEGSGGDVNLQSKVVNPSLTTQTIQADAGYDGLSSVIINPITDVISIYEGQTN